MKSEKCSSLSLPDVVGKWMVGGHWAGYENLSGLVWKKWKWRWTQQWKQKSESENSCLEPEPGVRIYLGQVWWKVKKKKGKQKKSESEKCNFLSSPDVVGKWMVAGTLSRVWGFIGARWQPSSQEAHTSQAATCGYRHQKSDKEEIQKWSMMKSEGENG